MAFPVATTFRNFCRSLLSVFNMPPSQQMSSSQQVFPAPAGAHSPIPKSGPSTTPTVVTFKNTTNADIQCFWVDYEGEEVPYEIIAPGKEYRQRTFVQHPWSFRDAQTKQRLVVNRKLINFPDDKASSDMVVTRPVELEWSAVEHSRFPQDFKTIMRDVLLWHNRVRSLDNQIALKYDGRQRASTADHMRSLPQELVLCILAKSAPKILDIVNC